MSRGATRGAAVADVIGMTRQLALVLVILAAMSGGARADGYYFSESFGGAKFKDQLSAYLPGSFRVHAAIGMRRGAWALETFVTADANDNDGTYVANNTGLLAYGLRLKYLCPLASHVDVYLHGSASYGFASGTLDGYGGRGLGVGAGIQLKGKVPALGFLFFPLFFADAGPKVTAALFLETGYEFYRLHDTSGGGGASIDAQINSMTGGFAVGTDF